MSVSSLDSGQRLLVGHPGKDTMSEVSGERCRMVTTGPRAHVLVWLSFPLNTAAGPASPVCMQQGGGWRKMRRGSAGLGTGSTWLALLCPPRTLQSLLQETTWSAPRPPEAWRHSPAQPLPPKLAGGTQIPGSPDSPGSCWQERVREVSDGGRELCVSGIRAE